MRVEFPEIPKDYEKKIGKFYEALGESFTRWQLIETAMFILSYAIMGCEYKMASVAFFHIKSQESKLKLVDKLCRAHFPQKKHGERDDPPIMKEWKAIYDKIYAGIKARNYMAHYEVNYVTDPSVLGSDEPPFILSSHHMDFNGGEKSLSTNTLKAFSIEYLDLGNEILGFVRKYFEIEPLRAKGIPPYTLRLLESPQKGGQK